MRRATVAAAGMIGLLIAIALSVSAAAAAKRPTKHAFTGTVLGDVILSNGTSYENAYKITTSADGTGAGWNQGSNSSSTSLPLTGRSTNYNYFADGVNPVRTTYTISAANASGVAVLTGSGECIAGGTRVFKHQKCKFTETGTYNVNTGIFHVELKGTYTR
jgi:hypothetical protein